jgi:putative addiction module component (TIGR02574 family)
MSRSKASASRHQRGVPERNGPQHAPCNELAASPVESKLTDAQRNELERRLEDYRRDPEAGVSWESLRDSLHGLT